MNDYKIQNSAMALIDDFVAEGKDYFSHADAMERTGRSPSATSNLLRRMVDGGLLDRVRRGRYVIRRFGVLGTRAAAESIAIAVGAAFADQPHRIAYRSALDVHDLIMHPARAIQVAATRRVRVAELSGRNLRVIKEPVTAIKIGAVECGPSQVSDLDRALLDAATRPHLVGGSAVLAQAIASAGTSADAARLTEYARILERPAALRRLGSIADALSIAGLAGALHPLAPPTGDISLDPRFDGSIAWRDSRWRVRWSQHADELANVVRQ